MGASECLFYVIGVDIVLIKKYKIDMEHPVVETYIKNRAFTYIKEQLGLETTENKTAYELQIQEVMALIREKKDYIYPNGEYVCSDEYHFVVEEVGKEQFCFEVTFALFCKEYKSDSVVESFLMHLIQIAFLNATRDYMKEYLVPMVYQYFKKQKAPFVTMIFGPGLFDMPMEAMSQMIQYIDSENITLKESVLEPEMSFVGCIYVTKERLKKRIPCKRCKANIGCEYCMVPLQWKEVDG